MEYSWWAWRRDLIHLEDQLRSAEQVTDEVTKAMTHIINSIRCDPVKALQEEQ